MKKIFIVALLVAFVATGGMFAYTFTTATATIAVSAPESDFAEIEAAAGPAAPTVFGKYTGTWSAGNLFTITPHDDYTGDLVVKVYFVNTGQLIRYYEHLNMAIEFQDSLNVDVDEQETFQVLNLQNAAIEFTWANATGTGPYTVEVTGGSFKLHGFKTLTGGSYSPQIWCEVTQR